MKNPATIDDPRTSARFWAKVEKSEGCWNWRAATVRGYGEFRIGGRSVSPMYAHRVSWTMANGPIPVGLLVLHHCDNRRCVRPSHLFLGTVADNAQDASRKGRLPQQRYPELYRGPEYRHRRVA